MPSYPQWMDTGLIILGLLFSIWFLRKKIDSMNSQIGTLKDTVSSQIALASNFKMYVEAFDPKRIRDYMALIDEIHQSRATLTNERYKDEKQKIEKMLIERIAALEGYKIAYGQDIESLRRSLELRDNQLDNSLYHAYYFMFKSSVYHAISLHVTSLTNILKRLFIYTVMGVNNKIEGAPSPRGLFDTIHELDEKLNSTLDTIKDDIVAENILADKPDKKYIENLSKICKEIGHFQKSFDDLDLIIDSNVNKLFQLQEKYSSEVNEP